MSNTSSNKPTLEELKTENKSHYGFNYYITRFFLNNSRLTILFLVLVILLGVASTLLMKTTGFPKIDSGLILVQTRYLGASSETVLKEVTQPIENAIKDVDGIDTYSSSSSNNFSIIRISLQSDVNSDIVNSRIDAAVKAVQLPENVTAPEVFKADFGEADYIFSINAPTLAETYDTYKTFKDDISQLPETKEISATQEIEKRVRISIDLEKMAEKKLSLPEVRARISSLGQTIPFTEPLILNQDNKTSQHTLTSSTDNDNIDTLRSLKFYPNNSPASSQTGTNPQSQNNSANTTGQNTPAQGNSSVVSPDLATPTEVLLTDFAKVDFEYVFVNNQKQVTNFNAQTAIKTDDAVALLSQPLVLSIRTVDNTDQSTFKNKIEDLISNYKDAKLITGENLDKTNPSEIMFIEHYSVTESNQEQVNEVIGGLIGGKLPGVDSPLAYAGYVLGGIQLVFLVMLAFVSWRAAIIAAISIPLSLIFSSIYLYFIGENFNTLVLFSLVLVIGLVVDPALVILESIQRKVDTGLKGKEAALAAVRDVGNGLFLATLTNIIVFLPFGVISGFLGEIFAYIPLTIIPATIGSYIVPLVFLAWMGGLILKPSKNKTENEEENLWPIAKFLFRLNTKILDSHPIFRALIVLLGLIIPLSISFWMISSGAVRFTTFASNDNAAVITFDATFLSGLSEMEKQKTVRESLEVITSDNNVLQTFPLSQGGEVLYYVELKESTDRTEKSVDIAKRLNNRIQERFGEGASSPKYFDSSVTVQETGPPVSSYQVSIAVKSNDLDKLEISAKDIDKTMRKVCFNNNRSVSIEEEKCSDGQRAITKVDNGFTGQENTVYNINFDSEKLAKNLLTREIILPQLSSKFTSNLGETGKITKDGQEIQIFLNQESTKPDTLDEIRNLEFLNPAQSKVTLGQVAEIKEDVEQKSIQRTKGQTLAVVSGRLIDSQSDQGTAAQVAQAVVEYYSKDDHKKTTDLGLSKDSVVQFSEGSNASTLRSFQQLLFALVLAIALTYIVLAVFFNSLTQPLVILYTIPLTFWGMFPALALFGGGQIGFLEIIGIIILVGVVENVAIFLIDAARQKINEDGWEEKKAIAFASAVRFRPVILTKFTAIASLAPLAVLSVFYRSISVVIIFGLLSSGFVSLITTPILYIFFRWLSRQFMALPAIQKILFLIPVFTPIYILVLAFRKKQA
jgi:hydrophobic/amphiphilic exporter-1 (mainly G- bacteria), HAE1 family